MEKENKTKKSATNKVYNEPMTLLQAVERIVDLSRDSKLSDSFMKKCSKEIQLVADAYGITPQQAILFCITLECGPYNVGFYELPRFLNMSNVKSLSFGPDINEMIKKRLLRYRDNDKDSFGVPEHILNALRENRAVIMPSIVVEDCDTLFDLMGTWFDVLEQNNISPKDLAIDLLKLLKDNNKISFAEQVLAMKLKDEELLVLLFFCNQLVNEDDNKILSHEMDDLFEGRRMRKKALSEMAHGTHKLMQMGLIEHVCEDGTANTSMFTLSVMARTKLLAELDLQQAEVKLSNVLKPDQIKAKSMFYPKAMEKQINELNGFLDDEQFVEIQRRLDESGFRTGFACLFYGAPGTGKTETVYQLARTTGRSIMLVDVPQIKSKWVGDSEKNIKALFDRYRELVKRCELAPILLFNEADAIFGVRKNGAENAVDKMENTIQNIILQEMESLHGIMIATTNLVSNLDGAFERRFLYKVKFEKPDATVRSRIWQEMIPDLSDKSADILANTYDLSGGQIENIARKNTINRILHGDNGDNLATLMEYCKAETLNPAANRPRMGF